MPFVGLGLHVLVALYFAVHVVRTGQQMYWLIILFSFPLLGSVVYFFAIYLPGSRLDHGTRKAARAAVKALDPTRELREARAAFDYTPTAQNQMRLAAALLEAGHAEEAASNYEACLKGPFASDLEIQLGAARASIECAQHAQAVRHLETIRAANPAFRAEQVSLLMAQALNGAQRPADAKAEFESAMQQFGSFQVRAEYAIWASGNGEPATFNRLKPELDQAMRRWPRHTRVLNAALVKRLAAAQAASRADDSADAGRPA